MTRPETWIIRALHALTTSDPALRKQAKKWFAGIATGRAHVPEENILEDDELALAALRVLLKYFDIPVVWFCDELETTYLSFGQDAQVQFLERIKRIYNECKNHIIILACITELYDRILEHASPSIQGRLERPVILKRFAREDIDTFVQAVLNDFWTKNGLEMPSPLFPLNKADLDNVSKNSRGNPREVIRWLRDTVELSKLSLVTPKNSEIKSVYNHARALSDLIRAKLDTVGVSVMNNGSSGAVIVFSPRNKSKKVAVISGTQQKEWMQEVLEAFDNESYELFSLSGSLADYKQVTGLSDDLNEAAQTILSELTDN